MKEETAKLAGLMLVLAFIGSSNTTNDELKSARDYEDVGCGLGSQAFGSKPGKVKRAMASTTDQTMSQSFSISSGTTGCGKGSVQRAESRQRAFIARNYDDVKSDISSGGGEHLYSLSNLMGCPESSIGEFAVSTQDRYEYIYKDHKPAWILYRIKKSIKRSPELRRRCRKVWW